MLALLTLLALGLRLYGLDAQSLWYDEGFSVYLARMSPAEITSRTAADIQPPLYYYLLHGWIQVLGDGEKALRGLSLLFGVLTVPLIYAVARQVFGQLRRNSQESPQRRHPSQLAGLLAALLVAVSPLHIWYGQEVRMYTLLTLLCLLSSYLLLLVIPLAIRGERKWQTLALWMAYTLVGIAALYTHYFAFFVLAFQALYLFLVWWEQGTRPRRLLLAGLISIAVTGLAFLPWLPFLINRYAADLSYWPGRLKIHEVVLDIAISFIAGESVFESTGAVLTIGYALVFLLCAIALSAQVTRDKLLGARQNPQDASYVPQGTLPEPPDSEGRKPQVPDSMVPVPGPDPSHLQPETLVPDNQHRAPSTQYPLAFLLLYLIIPPALILILSYNTPKFNARYAMIAQPALSLIVAGGLAVLLQKVKSRRGNILRWTLAALALTFVLGVSAYAVYNAYANPAFARADFRGVTRYLSNHVESDETVILTSGHMFPVFDYYAPGTERHLLPDSPTLDTTRTLNYAIAEDLNTWLSGQGGVWLVLWQDKVVDPVGYLTSMLAEKAEERAIVRGFSQVELRHFRLPAGTHFSEQPVIDHPADLNFGHQLQLLGYSQTGDRQVTLYWKVLQPLKEDYRVSLTLRDPAGQSWGQWDGRPTAYLYPTDRWPEDQIVFGRYDLTLLPGTPPGEYGLEVGVYTQADPVGLDLLDQEGAPQGKRAMLGGVQLAVPVSAPEQLAAPQHTSIDLEGDLSLLGWDLDRDTARPGDPLLLTLFWSADSQPAQDYSLRLLVADGAGRELDAGAFPLTNRWHPTSAWSEGEAWRGQTTFRLPLDAEPGTAQLSLQLVDSNGTDMGSSVNLAMVEVLTTDRLLTPPQPQISIPAVFGDQIAFLGLDLDPDPALPGEPLYTTLYWQALKEMDVPFTVFIHLLGSDGRVVVGHDSQPINASRPTTGWVPGEYIADPHELSIPPDLAPGVYLIEVGLYDAGSSGLPRLPILDDQGQVASDRVLFEVMVSD